MDPIVVERVSKSYRLAGQAIAALNNVSLTVREGEILGLLGPNGAGKTTLLHIINGLLLPDRGAVRVRGIPAANRRTLGVMNFVSPDLKFHWALHGRDVLDFFGRVYGLSRAQRAARIAELGDFLDLRDLLDRRVSFLSTGEKMRLVFAKSLLNSPKVILFDEPTLGLDPHISVLVRREIRRINRELGTSMLLTSHYMREVEELADRIAFINKGRIVDEGTVSSVKRKHFQEFELVVSVERIQSKKPLRALGFRIRGNTLSARLRDPLDVGRLLDRLAKQRLKILEVHTKRPTLEDYFIRVLGQPPETVEKPP